MLRGYLSVCQVQELMTENTQLKERVALLEKLLDSKKEDGQLLDKMVDYVYCSQCYHNLSHRAALCIEYVTPALA